MRGTIKASKSLIYETLDRYKDRKYSDGDLVIGWMKNTGRFHIYRYKCKIEDDPTGNEVYVPVPNVRKIIIRVLVPYNEDTKWLLDAVPEDNQNPNEYLCSMMRHFIKKLMY